MIEFDQHGNPLPSGLINMTIEDFKRIFVDEFHHSQTRSFIFNGYTQFIEDFQNEIIREFRNWVNGSYVTRKENPNDIDVVSLIQFTDNLNSKWHLLYKFLTTGGSEKRYHVDGYFIPVYSEDDPRYALTQELVNYWKEWFGTDREGRKKGIVQLSFS